MSSDLAKKDLMGQSDSLKKCGSAIGKDILKHIKVQNDSMNRTASEGYALNHLQSNKSRVSAEDEISQDHIKYLKDYDQLKMVYDKVSTRL
jgi:hypothetical protein